MTELFTILGKIAIENGGANSAMSRVVYTIVGLSAVWCISLLFRETDPVEEHT